MMDEQLRDNVDRLLQDTAEAPSPEFMARLERLVRPPAPPKRQWGLLQALRWTTAAAAALSVALLAGILYGHRVREPRVPAARTSESRPEALAYVQAPGLGSLIAKDEEGRMVGELGLREHLVTVEILDGVAKTTVEENFQNHTDRRLEGSFLFPLPPDASISRLALEVNGKIEEGTCLERERARQVFESIVSRMKDPALLEWQPGGLFKCRIFPIEPHATKRVIVAYTQALPVFRGKMTYVYPLASEKTRAHPPDEVKIDVLARFSGALSTIESPSHHLDVRRKNPNEASMSFHAIRYRPNNDFVVSLEPVEEELRVVSHKIDGEDGYFACFVTPRGGGGRVPGRYKFVLDASASISAPKLDVAKRLVRAMMERRIEGDRFEILAHNVTVERSGEVDLRAANDFMDRIRPIGGSDLLGALRAASAEPGEVIYIGRGALTYGETEASKILAAVKDRRIRTIAVGSDANLGLLEKLGGLMQVSPNDDVPKRAREIAETLGSPVISGIKVEGGDAVYDVVGLRDLFYGERLMAAGRYRGATAKLAISGGGYRREMEVAFPVKEEGNNYVRRLWAQRKVSELLAQGPARQAELTDLGVKYQIMTPYTSFLVLENEQMWKDHELKREVQKQDQLLGKLRDEEKKRMAEFEANAHEITNKREVIRKIAQLLELAYMAFDQKRFDKCIKLCNEVLLIDPHYPVARELREDSEKTRHKDEYFSVLARKVEQWKKLTDDDEQAIIPDSQRLRYPTREEWAEISRRLTTSVIRTEGGAADPPAETVRPSKGGGGPLTGATFTLDEEKLRLDLLEEGRARNEYRHLSEVKREVELLFGQAQMYFEQEKFAQSAEVCEKILRVNPNLTSVVEMRNVAQRAPHMKASHDALKKYVAEWKRTFEQVELNATVQSSELEFPSIERAKEAVGRRSVKNAAAEGAPDIDGGVPLLELVPDGRTEKEWFRLSEGGASDEREDPDLLAIQRKLDTMKMDLKFDNAKLEDVLAFVRDFSGLNIILDAQVRDRVDPDKPVTIKLADLPLKDHLRRVIAPFGLDYTITEENVVLLTDPWKALIARRQPKGLATIDEDLDEEDLTLQEKLLSIRVTIDMVNAPLTACVDYIREISGLNIHIGGFENPEAELVSLQVQDMALDGALRMLLLPHGKTYVVRNGVVLICPVVTVRSVGDNDRELILQGRTLQPRQLLVVMRGSRFVAVVQVQDGVDSGHAPARVRLSVDRLHPGDQVREVGNLRRYLAGLPPELRLEMASRANQQTIRAKMGLKP